MYDISATVKWDIFTSENKYFCKTLVLSLEETFARQKFTAYLSFCTYVL